jgi:PAS domain S-box-containing protein
MHELNVLIVEDVEDEAFLVLRNLKQHWETVNHQRVQNEAELREALTKKWDLVISDYSLPGFNGARALKIVKETGIDIPFILVSGKIGEDVAVSLMREGALDYVMKDNLRRLVEVVRRELEDARIRRDLREAEKNVQTLSHVARLTNNGVMITDKAGNIEWVNDAFLALSGYTLDEVKGKNPGALLQGRDTDPNTIKYLTEQIRANKSFNCEILNYTKQNQKIWIELFGQPIFSSTGEVDKFFAIQIDISERKEVEEREKNINRELEIKVKERTSDLEQLNKELDRFNSVISHDLRGPIRQVNMFCDLLQRNLNKAPQSELLDTVSYIKRNVVRMNSIVERLLEFSRLANKQITLGEVELQKEIESQANDIKVQYDHRAIEFNCDKLPVVKGDPVLIQQIFYNLLSNAFKYSSKKETIKVRVGYRDDNKYHIFFVSDNGAGFDMKHHDTLFEPFKRLHNESEFEGVGLGLANVKRFVEKHKGKIWAESTQNVGSTFYVALPK